MEAWRRETEPLALGLLGLKPWEFDRCTVGEVEDMIAGVYDRLELQWDLLGRHALVSAGYPKGTTLSEVLGRDPHPIDTRYQADAGDADPNDDQRYEDDLIEDAVAIAKQYEASGMAKTGRLTPEELAQARREAHVR